MTPDSPVPFDVEALLNSAGAVRTVASFQAGAVIYVQGDPCRHVLYLQDGRVKLSVVSHTGQAAVVAMLRRGDFFGETCLAGHPVNPGSATALSESRVLVVDKTEMLRLLRTEHAVSDRFIAHLLARNIRIEEDLVDQLFHSAEQRLARTLLLLARASPGHRVGEERAVMSLPRISQTTLAEMIGTTRSRVNFFMKKFERMGLIDCTNGLKLNSALRTVAFDE